jgi:hypothetical protein
MKFDDGQHGAVETRRTTGFYPKGDHPGRHLDNGTEINLGKIMHDIMGRGARDIGSAAGQDKFLGRACQRGMVVVEQDPSGGKNVSRALYQHEMVTRYAVAGSQTGAWGSVLVVGPGSPLGWIVLINIRSRRMKTGAAVKCPPS